jgi:hypothetical protein
MFFLGVLAPLSPSLLLGSNREGGGSRESENARPLSPLCVRVIWGEGRAHACAPGIAPRARCLAACGWEALPAKRGSAPTPDRRDAESTPKNNADRPVNPPVTQVRSLMAVRSERAHPTRPWRACAGRSKLRLTRIWYAAFDLRRSLDVEPEFLEQDPSVGSRVASSPSRGRDRGGGAGTPCAGDKKGEGRGSWARD